MRSSYWNWFDIYHFSLGLVDDQWMFRCWKFGFVVSSHLKFFGKFLNREGSRIMKNLGNLRTFKHIFMWIFMDLGKLTIINVLGGEKFLILDRNVKEKLRSAWKRVKNLNLPWMFLLDVASPSTPYLKSHLHTQQPRKLTKRHYKIN